jgi:hypothetical protein
MAGIVQITQGGPRTFTPAVGVTVKGGQFVEQRDDGRIQPAGAASIRTVGVALTDGMAPEDVNTSATLNSFGRPVIVAVPVPTAVAVAYDAAEVYVTASALVKPGQRVICAANGQVTVAATMVNDVQTVSFGGTVTGGTFTLTFTPPVGSPQTTAAIAWNATAAAVQAALQTLTGIGANCTVTGGPGPASYVVTFNGTLSGDAITLMTASGTNLTGTSPTVSVAHTTTGSTTSAAPADQVVGICTDPAGIAANAIGRVRITL